MATVLLNAAERGSIQRVSEGSNLQAQRPDDFLRSLGLGGIRMTYGVFATESTR